MDGIMLMVVYFAGIRADCIHRKYEGVDGHTACLDINTRDIVEKGISEEEKQMILDLHNQYRANEPAANMQKMVWDGEIAQIAEKWTDNCQYKHDKGSKRSIPGRFSVGQNLALGYGSWDQVIAGWYNEVDLFTYNSSQNIFSAVGHFTQLAWAASTKLGCAYTKCSNLATGFYNGKFYACNYGPAGNIGNYNTPYKKKVRSKCEDCPGHCDEELQICDCGGKACENGGTMDLATCTCSCDKDFHVGEECGLDCSAATDKRWCGTQFPPSYCARFSNVPYDCPNMCGVCPYGGIAYRNHDKSSTTTKGTPTTRRPQVTTTQRIRTTTAQATTARTTQRSTTRRPKTRRPTTTTQRPTTTRSITRRPTTNTTQRPTTRKPKTIRPVTSETTTTSTSSTTLRTTTNRSPCLAKKYESVEGHTACIVPDTAQIIEKGVSEQERRLIVDLHNQYRAAQPATNMQKIRWDDELAAIAERWADNCNYNHDRSSARAIPGRFSVGQNLALGHSSWENVITAWYNEVELFTYNSSSNNFAEIGHYTQMTWAETNKIGCAYTKCSNLATGFYNGKFYACNYGPAGNVGNYNTPYKKKVRSKCEDCPGHCDEELQICDCGGKTCENGGTMDLATCTCSCKRDFHVGDECKLDCSLAQDSRWCGTQWPTSYCRRYNNVPFDCPHMCGVCPYGGISYSETNYEAPDEGDDKEDEDNSSTTSTTTEFMTDSDNDMSTSTTSTTTPTDGDPYTKELEGGSASNSTPAPRISDLVKQLLVCLFTACVTM